jgi:Fe-S-cluster containining protein
MKQLIPQEFCLKCKGCCRFSKENSPWAPCLLDEEIQGLLDRKNIPPACIGLDRRIHPVPNPEGEGYLCAFFDINENRCKIYEFRPFECQLYPFLINLRNKKVILTVDLNCPYVKDNLKSREFKEYTDYLVTFLNTPKQIKILKDNPQLMRAYEEVLEIIELNI